MAPIKRVGWICGQYVNNYFWWGLNSRGSASVEWLILTEDRHAWPGLHDRCQIYRSVLWSRSSYWQRNERPPGRWMGSFPQGVSCLLAQVWPWTRRKANWQARGETSVSSLNLRLLVRLGNKSPRSLRVTLGERVVGGGDRVGTTEIWKSAPPQEWAPSDMWCP